MSITKVKKPHRIRKKDNSGLPLRLSILKVSGLGICQLKNGDHCQDQTELKVSPQELQSQGL